MDTILSHSIDGVLDGLGMTLTFDGAVAADPVSADSIDYLVNLGKPIFSQTAAQIEENADTTYQVLRSWIALDAGNIALRNIGRVAVRTPVTWETNTPLRSEQALQTTYWYGPDFRLVERDLAPILTALAHNYHHAISKSADPRLADKLAKLSALLATMPEFLDSHGRDCAEGKWS